MLLSIAIQRNRESVLTELAAVHDYYVNTKRAWRTVQRMVSRRGRFTSSNSLTGNRITESDLPQKAQLYVADYLAGATFQQFVSLFEDFTFGVMQSWLLAFPQRLARKQLPASIALNATDLESVKIALVNRELNEIRYRSVGDWFSELEHMVNGTHGWFVPAAATTSGTTSGKRWKQPFTDIPVSRSAARPTSRWPMSSAATSA